MDRRKFLVSTAAVGCAALTGAAWRPRVANKLPAWKGFNLLDFFSPDPAEQWSFTKEEYFKWMQDWGFDFVRIPIAYPYYLNIDRSKNIKPEDTYKLSNEHMEKIDALILLAHKYNLHVSLNLHRAPGYCVNAGFHEPFNLWTDESAMDAFRFHWETWAKRYKNTSADRLSFDLLNEPSLRKDMNDQLSDRSTVPGHLYRKMASTALDVIKKQNPKRIVVADGNNVGNDVIPEIAELDIAQSCRGYFPGIISHYKAPWAMKEVDNLPELKWPGKVGDQYLSVEMLEEYYKPWIELMQKGVGVHCGECGCWNKTPHHIFLAWFKDVLDILARNKIGFALWEFSGAFGILDSSRQDVQYEDWYGHKLDRKLLNLLSGS